MARCNEIAFSFQVAFSKVEVPAVLSRISERDYHSAFGVAALLPNRSHSLSFSRGLLARILVVSLVSNTVSCVSKKQNPNESQT